MPLHPFGFSFFIPPAACSQKHQGWKRHLNHRVQQLKALYWKASSFTGLSKSSSTSNYWKSASIAVGTVDSSHLPLLAKLPKCKWFPWLIGNIPKHQIWLKTPNPADITDGNSVSQEIWQLGKKSKRGRMQTDNWKATADSCLPNPYCTSLSMLSKAES